MSAAPQKYRHLQIPLKPGYVLSNLVWESPARHRLRRLIARAPLAGRALQALRNASTRLAGMIDYMTSLTHEEHRNRAYAELLARDSAAAQEPDSGYGSPDAVSEFGVTLQYARIFQGDHAADRTGTVSAAQCVEQTFDGVAAADATLSACLNFGVSYAYADAALAARHPGVEFIGVDRSPLTKALNELAFGGLANLQFVADDIFRVLERRRFERGAFLHCRTLVQLPMSFIERLYERVRAAGFEYVLGVEPVGLSRATGKSYEYSDERAPSVLFRDNLFLHNYPGLLAQAGYAVEKIGLARTTHPHEDYRLLWFVGRRADSAGRQP